jgi:hypothetical protein
MQTIKCPTSKPSYVWAPNWSPQYECWVCSRTLGSGKQKSTTQYWTLVNKCHSVSASLNHVPVKNQLNNGAQIGSEREKAMNRSSSTDKLALPGTRWRVWLATRGRTCCRTSRTSPIASGLGSPTVLMRLPISTAAASSATALAGLHCGRGALCGPAVEVDTAGPAAAWAR